MAPLPMPERADAADASRLVELSVRRGWPLASLRKAPFEDRHAVLAGFALYAEAGKGDAADAAKKFLAGAGSFLSGTDGTRSGIRMARAGWRRELYGGTRSDEAGARS